MRMLTLVRKNVLRKKMRFALLFISIAIAFFLYGSLSTVRTALSYGADNSQNDRYIVANKINFTQPLPFTYAEQVRRIQGVTVATPSAWFGGYFREPKNFVVAYAAELDSYLAVYSEYDLPPEQRASCLAQRDGLLVGEALSRQYNWSVGDQVTLLSSIYQPANGGQGWPFTVCGIFTDERAQGSEISALMHYDYFDGNRLIGGGTVNFVTLRVESGVDAQELAAGIDGRFANSPFETKTSSEQQFTAAMARQFGDIGLIVSFVVGAAFASMIVIVGSSTLLSIRERTRELAILKTLGFPRQKLLVMVAGEAFLIMFAGGVSGLAAAQILTSLISRSPSLASFAMQPTTWISGIAWIVLFALAIAIAPTYRALKLNVLSGLGRQRW